MLSLRTKIAALFATVFLMLSTGGVAVAQVDEIPVAPMMDPTGYYYYECISSMGTGYWLKPGEKTSNCKGSYLKAYISGNLARTISLTPAGTPAKKYKFNRSTECLLSIGVTAYGILTASGKVAWVANSVSGALTLRSCYSAK